MASNNFNIKEPDIVTLSYGELQSPPCGSTRDEKRSFISFLFRSKNKKEPMRHPRGKQSVTKEESLLSLLFWLFRPRPGERVDHQCTFPTKDSEYKCDDGTLRLLTTSLPHGSSCMLEYEDKEVKDTVIWVSEVPPDVHLLHDLVGQASKSNR